MSKETGGQAFPRPAVFTAVHGLASIEQDGMTLRDYFAAKAMQMLAGHSIERITEDAYKLADAMLKAREQ